MLSAFKDVYQADVSLLIGTSGFVEPVSMMVPLMYERGVYIIEINPRASLNSAYVFNLIEKNAEDALPELVRGIKNGKI